MWQFSGVARWYIVGSILAGVATFLWTLYQIDTLWHDIYVVPVMCLVTALASLLRVRIRGKGHADDTAVVSLGSMAVLFTLLRFGAFAGVLAAVVSAVVTTDPRKSPYYQVLFSAASVVLSSFAAFGILSLCPVSFKIPHSLDLFSTNGWTNILVLFCYVELAALADYLVNSILVAFVIALTSDSGVLAVWKENFRWLWPGYLLSGSCALILFVLLGSGTPAVITGVTLLVLVPIGGIAHLWQKANIEKEREHQNHVLELTDMNSQLTQTNGKLDDANQQLEAAHKKIQGMFSATASSLALAIDAKDRFTRAHVLRVQKLTLAIAMGMGISGDDLKNLELGALLHDIGKVGVPDRILSKPGKLTEEEFTTIRRHPIAGEDILKPVEFHPDVLGVVRGHHERWNGTGYPDGLAGEAIPLGGRILAVADVYDALTSERSYREPWAADAAIQYIWKNKGTHFDPDVVQAFLEVIDTNLQRTITEIGQSLTTDRNGTIQRLSTNREPLHPNRFGWERLKMLTLPRQIPLSVPETLSMMAEAIQDQFNASTCVIFLFAEGENVLEVREAVGVNAEAFESLRVKVGYGLTGQVGLGNDTYVGEYVEDDLRVNLDSSNDRKSRCRPLRSALIAPLVFNTLCIGTINVYHEEENTFDSESLRLLLGMSGAVARTIHTAMRAMNPIQMSLEDFNPYSLTDGSDIAALLGEQMRVAKQKESEFAILLLDMDVSERIGDAYGHARGHEVLYEIGVAFKSVLRSNDIITRYGGDTYMVVLPGADTESARGVVSKLRSTLNEYNQRPRDIRLPVIYLSVGIAVYPHNGNDASALVEYAEIVRERQTPKPANRLRLVA